MVKAGKINRKVYRECLTNREGVLFFMMKKTAAEKHQYFPIAI